MTSSGRTLERIEVIDVLRGFTLFGIVLAHMVDQYYAGLPPEHAGSFASTNLADGMARAFTEVFISGKFYMIFAFLFGLSFHLQLSRSSNRSSFLLRFSWRLAVLFMIGLVHHLHFRGDILTIYAMLGFGLLLLYRLPDRYLLIAGIVLLLNVPSVVVRGIDVLVPDGALAVSPAADQTVLLKYFDTLKSGAYVDILRANFFEFGTKMRFQFSSGRIYITFGLFLLGLCVGRRRVFEDLPSHLPSIRRLLKLSARVLLGCVLCALAGVGGAALFEISITEQALRLIGGMAIDLFSAALAAFYVAGVIVLFQQERWRGRLMNFHAVGRMGLTTYLMQTVCGALILFGIGWGLLAEMGASLLLAIAVAVFAIQIVFSEFWLKHFDYGIVEWLWRSLTYLKRQPLKKRQYGPSRVTDAAYGA